MQDDPIKEKLTYICKQFRIPGDILVYRWIPSGHINTAYYTAIYNGKEVTQLLVQKIKPHRLEIHVSFQPLQGVFQDHLVIKSQGRECVDREPGGLCERGILEGLQLHRMLHEL